MRVFSEVLEEGIPVNIYKIIQLDKRNLKLDARGVKIYYKRIK